MAFDTVVDRTKLEASITATAGAIRSKTGNTDKLNWDTNTGFANAIAGLSVEELIQHADIPDYVKGEALRVAQQVQAVREDDSIVFLAMSDNHHYGEQADADQYPDANGVQTNESNLHAAMAAKILAYGLGFDFMAQLGDATWGSQSTTLALLHAQADELMTFLREAHKDIPCFHAIGNHDTNIYRYNYAVNNGMDNPEAELADGDWLYDNFTALSASDHTVFGGQANGGYCYRDFSDKKLRVFLLNTSEALVANQQDKAALGSQRKWLANALTDLNSKSDAASWSFLLLSHYPADYGNTMPLSELLKAYVEGKSIAIALESGANETVSFSGKNSAKMIAQFHGHVHNFLTSKLYTYEGGQGVQYDAWRICIPNGQYNRENYYSTVGNYTDISFADAAAYGKTPRSAKDTSFVVNVINPTEQKIYSFCYGAGYDRVIGYAATVYYSVTANLTNVTLTGGAWSVEAGQPYRATLTIADGYEWKQAAVTMGGVDVTASVYSGGVIDIPAVTGNIVITASAARAVSYTNQIPISTDASGNIYNGTGFKSGYRLSSSGGESTMAGSYVTGFIPVKAGDGVYLKNVQYEKVASGSLTPGNQRVCFYDANRTFLGLANGLSTAVQDRVFDGDILIQFTVKDTGDFEAANAAYFRINAAYIGEDSVITVNEPIE